MKAKIIHFLKVFFESFVWLFLLFLFLDILSKNLVVYYSKIDPRLALDSGSGVVLIPGFLRIQYVVNRNVAFGLGLGSYDANRVVFIIVALLISGGILFYYIRNYKKLNKFIKATLMLILVGAIGNAVDRIFFTGEYLGSGYNGVVDWIDFYGIWSYHFNIADSCVVVGAIMLIIYMIIEEIIDYRKKKKLEANAPKEKEEKVLSVEEKKRLEIKAQDENRKE